MTTLGSRLRREAANEFHSADVRELLRLSADQIKDLVSVMRFLNDRECRLAEEVEELRNLVEGSVRIG